MNKTIRPIVFKLGITFFSLIFFLGLLEAGLRITGYFYSLNRANSSPSVGSHSITREEERGEVALSTKEGYAILCLGDSYTYAGNVPYNETYPSYLQRILTDKYPSKKYSVINGGICEYNSKQVLARLPGFIKKYEPDVVILLVGSSDKFNLAGYSFHEKGIKSLFYNSRIYKMFKIIMLNLKAKVLIWKARGHMRPPAKKNLESVFGIDDFPAEQTRDNFITTYFDQRDIIDSYSENQSPIEQAWYYYNNDKRQEAIRICEEALKFDPDSVDILCDLAHFYYYIEEEVRHSPPYSSLDEKRIQAAEALYNKAFQIAPNSEFVLYHLAHFYYVVGEDYLFRHKYDLAVELLLKAIKLDPSFYVPYYLLARSQELQSKYDANYIVELFQKMVKSNPELKENKLFVKYFSFFQNREEWEEEIDKQLGRNLEGIVNLCQKKGLKVIIQNYPYPYAAANRALKSITLKYSLPFVDNRTVFKQLVESKGWATYFHFYNDEHCSTQGYRTIAENIYNVFVKEGVLGER